MTPIFMCVTWGMSDKTFPVENILINSQLKHKYMYRFIPEQGIKLEHPSFEKNPVEISAYE
jgi:hypothetical protein